jgi:S-DNA-T family DNA segregation ATPase FtsK/SpoIIIE
MSKSGKEKKFEVTYEIIGIILAVASVFLLVSLFSFDPADGPDPSRIPRNQSPGNACGTIGAYISYYMFRFVGILPSYSISILIGIWGALCIARVEIRKAWFKTVSAIVFVIAFAAVERMAIPTGYFTGRLTGGYFGTYLGTQLLGYLGPVGAYLVVLGVLGISLLLATELMFYDILKQLAIKSRVLVKHARSAAGAAVAATGAAVRSIPVKARPEQEAEEIPVVAVAEPDEEKEKKRLEKKKKKEEKARKKAERKARKEAERKKKEKERKAKAAKATKEPKEAPAPKPKDGKDRYELPPLDLLSEPDEGIEESADIIQRRASTIEKTLESFNIGVQVVALQKGPVITQYEISLAPGVKASKIASLSEDLAMALRAPSVRTVYPIPGKSTVGIEVPNTKRAIVRLKELLSGSEPGKKKKAIPLFLGRDAAGAQIEADLGGMPHLLIAGATGAGKSVCINSIITSVLYTRTPEEVKLILIDPKMVELSLFEDLPHLLHPVVTDMGKAAGVLEWAMQKMDERYETLQLLGVRNIKNFNQLSRQERERRLASLTEEEREDVPGKLPYIVIIIDELADLMMAGSKAVEGSITRLAQKSRAVGIHLVLATQRPSVDVITGLIKTNMPCRIAFHVASKIDSRTILDRNGAEALLMQGDMLYLQPGASTLVRAQGTYIDEDETRRVVKHLKQQAKPEFNEELLKWQPEGKGGLVVEEGKPPQEIDELYNQAVEIILSSGRGSVSLLQRKLGIGYGRASRLIDIMEMNGVVGPTQGSKPREPLMTLAQWHDMQERASE